MGLAKKFNVSVGKSALYRKFVCVAAVCLLSLSIPGQTFANSTQSSPAFSILALGDDLSNYKVEVILSCRVFEFDGDGDYYDRDCKEYDADNGGTDPNQSHLNSREQQLQGIVGTGRLSFQAMEVYRSIRPLRQAKDFKSISLNLYVHGSEVNPIGHFTLKENEISNAANVWQKFTITHRPAQTLNLEIQDSRLSQEELLNNYPKNMIGVSQFLSETDGSPIWNWGLGDTLDTSVTPLQMELAEFTIARLGDHRSGYAYVQKVEIEFPNFRRQRIEIPANTNAPIPSPQIFKTSLGSSIKYMNHVFRVAGGSYEGRQTQTNAMSFTGIGRFSCDAATRVLTMELNIKARTGEEFKVTGTDTCYDAVWRMRFNAPIWDGNGSFNWKPVAVGYRPSYKASGFSDAGTRIIGIPEDTQPATTATHTFSMQAAEYKELPDFPGACIDAKTAMKVALAHKYKFGFNSGMPRYFIDRGTYAYANRAPEGSNFANRQEYHDKVNSMFGAGTLTDSSEEHYVFFGETAYMGCLADSFLWVGCDRQVRHVVRTFDCW